MARIVLSEAVGGSGPGVGLLCCGESCNWLQSKLLASSETYRDMYLAERSADAIGSTRIWGEDGHRWCHDGGRTKVQGEKNTPTSRDYKSSEARRCFEP